MAIITPDDIPTGSCPEDAVKWIRKAETRLKIMLKRRGVSLDALVADAYMLPVVQDVLQNAVLRVLRNPEGIRSESEGSYSVTVNPLDSAGNIWFPDADLDLLAPRATSVGTIRLTLPPERQWPR